MTTKYTTTGKAMLIAGLLFVSSAVANATVGNGETWKQDLALSILFGMRAEQFTEEAA